MRLIEENWAEVSLGGNSEKIVRFEMRLIGKRRQSHGAKHMAQRAIIAGGVGCAVVLVVAGLIGLRRVVHLMRRVLVLRLMLAKRHHGRGVALQRKPQHEADQE